MKKLLFLGLFLLAAAAALLAQPSTIQVSVSDTIEVPANHIMVLILFKDTTTTSPLDIPTYDMDMPKPDARTTPDFSASHAEVVRLLDLHQVSWKKASDQLGFLGALSRMGNSNADKPEQEIMADFHSLAQLNAVLPQIKAVAFADVTETGTSVDKDLLDLSRLNAKLFKKSRAKAEGLARLANKKVGGVYQISAVPVVESTASNPLGDMMGAMLGGLGNMGEAKRADYKVAVKESLLVTYYLLD